MTSEPSETPPPTPAVPVPTPSADKPASAARSKIKIGSQRDTFPAPGPPLAPPRPAFKPQPVTTSPKPLPPPPDAAIETVTSALPLPPAPAPVSTVVPLPEAQVAPPQPAATPTPPSMPAAEVPSSMEAPVLTKPVSKGPVPIPRYDDTSADFEQEMSAALGNLSIDQLITKEDAKRTGPEFETESRHRAMVVRVHRDNVFFSLGSRNEAVAGLKHFKTPPETGTMMEVVVTGFNAEDGLYEVSVPGASIDVSGWSDIVEGSIVDARVTGANTGGLECAVNTLRGFIPASQVSLYRVENLGEFIGQKLACVVTEANPERRNLVLSHRAVLEREKEASREEFLGKLEVGQIHEGVVRSIRDFGAFVDLGGMDGLIHVSKLSWDHVKHPSEVLQEGQKVSVKIERIDPDTGKIGLSYRDLQDHPWKTAAQKYTVGSIVNGVVSRLANFGAFVKLGPGVEGLIHISELSHQHVRNVGQILKEGQAVEVKILSVDPDAQRIALSLKATMPAPESAKAASEPAAEEPRRELAVPQRKGPLKGGLGKVSGGDQFGLRW
jgi:small subunit ribosomal protein S1